MYISYLFALLLSFSAGIYGMEIDNNTSEDNEPMCILKGHKGSVNKLVYDEKNNRLISASSDKTIRVWNLGTQEVIKTFQEESEVFDLGYDGDGYVFAGFHDKTISKWDLKSGKRIYKKSPEGIQMKPLLVMPTAEFAKENGFSMEFINNIIYGSADNNIHIWDEETNEVTTLNGHCKPITCFKSHCTDLFVSGDDNGTICVWDLRYKKLCNKLIGHKAKVNAIERMEDDIISISDDCTLRIWDR